jgi:hypothetical protein
MPATKITHMNIDWSHKTCIHPQIEKKKNLTIFTYFNYFKKKLLSGVVDLVLKLLFKIQIKIKQFFLV